MNVSIVVLKQQQTTVVGLRCQNKAIFTQAEFNKLEEKRKDSPFFANIAEVKHGSNQEELHLKWSAWSQR